MRRGSRGCIINGDACNAMRRVMLDNNFVSTTASAVSTPLDRDNDGDKGPFHMYIYFICEDKDFKLLSNSYEAKRITTLCLLFHGAYLKVRAYLCVQG